MVHDLHEFKMLVRSGYGHEMGIDDGSTTFWALLPTG